MTGLHFASLPQEIFRIILSYAFSDHYFNNFRVHQQEGKSIIELDHNLKFICVIQSLNKKINNTLKEYFDEFWIEICKRYFRVNDPIQNSRFDNLIKKMITQDELKRKMILARFIMFLCFKRAYEKRASQSNKEYFKAIVFGSGGVGKYGANFRFIG